MIDWTFNIAGIIASIFVLIGFIGTWLVGALWIGRFVGAVDNRLHVIDERTKNMTELLVKMAQQKTELVLLNSRVNDIQKHGSYKLAELVDTMRTQIMAESRERFEILSAQ